jgi:hypothetical protein
VTPGTKPDPLTVTGNVDPAMPLLGVMDEMTGTGFWIENNSTLEIPAEGEGFCTVTEALLTEAPATSDAKMVAVNCVALTN